NSLGWHHWVYPFAYALYAAALWWFASKFTWDAGDWVRYFATAVLCVLIVVFSSLRQHSFLKLVGAPSAAAPLTRIEFDEHVARLSAVLNTNSAAQTRIQGLETLVEKTRRTVEELKQELTQRHEGRA